MRRCALETGNCGNSGWKVANPLSHGDPRDLMNGCGNPVDDHGGCSCGVHGVGMENPQNPGNGDGPVPCGHGSLHSSGDSAHGTCGSVPVVHGAYGSFCGIRGLVYGVYSSVHGSVDSDHGSVHSSIRNSIHGSVDGVYGSVHGSVDSGHSTQCLSGVLCSHDGFPIWSSLLP